MFTGWSPVAHAAHTESHDKPANIFYYLFLLCPEYMGIEETIQFISDIK